jgi:hypothetical protein
VADLPLLARDRRPGPTRGALRSTLCSRPPAILRVPPPPLADQAVLFLRRVASMQPAALDRARTWATDPHRPAARLKTNPSAQPEASVAGPLGDPGVVTELRTGGDVAAASGSTVDTRRSASHATARSLPTRSLFTPRERSTANV